MKTIKKAFAMLLAVVMVLGLSVTAFADDATPYSITVKNTPSSTNVSIVGKTFSAYKIFDVSYADTDNTEGNDAFAYTISNSSSWFAPVMQYMGYTKGTGDNADKWGKTSEDGSWIAETNSYYTGGGLKLTPTANDPTKYVVETTVDSDNKTQFGDDQARALADFLTTWLNSQTSKPTADGTGAGAEVTNSDPKTEQAVISNLPAAGYYLVTGEGTADDNQTVVAAAALSTTDPTAEIDLKAEAPTVDKDIKVSGNTNDSTTADYNSAAVGDNVPYVVTSKVPDMTGYSKYYFVVTDTLSTGLTFNYDVAVKIGETTKSGIYVKTETVEGTTSTKYSTDGKNWQDTIPTVGTDTEAGKLTDYDYVVYVPGDSSATFEIVFTDFIQYKSNTGDAIEITYSATVNGNVVIGTAGNKNDVTLTYSNNPGTTDNGDSTNPNKPTTGSPVGVTPKSTTYTYVTGIELIKVDPDGNRLTGAQFKITGEKLNTVLVETETFTKSEDGEYWALKVGSYTTTAPVYADGTTYESNKYYTYDENSGRYTEYSGDMTDYNGAPVLYCKSTDTANTTYVQYTGYLYTSLTDKYTKTVTKTSIVKAENVSYTGTVGADGVLYFDGLSAGTYTITENAAPDGYNLLTSPITVVITCTVPGENSTSTDCTWAAKDGSGTNAENYTVTTDGVVQIDVENSTGSELPSTGGIGTTIFYVVGSILVIGAAVLLITKKRMSGAEK